MSENRKEYQRKWFENHREKQKEYRIKRRSTPLGRAEHLIGDYKLADKNANRGEGDLTKEWIVDNILSKPCAHCGIEGWKVIGCNRLDNSKPHTMDNVEPCCRRCNSKLQGRPKKSFDQIDPKTGDVVKHWDSIKDAKKSGFNHISSCLKNGKCDKGYIFKEVINEYDI